MDGAKIAREYLEKRGLKKETIETWQVGFIPDQWDLLTQYFLKKGIGVDDLVAAGLVIKKDPARAGQGFYDRFRGRIMFPIWDVHGNVVGFTGRVLVETENSGGKYVNTPQTLAYDKSRVIYGLDKAKIEIKTQDQVVLVEGQMDVIACHQAGMKNVVASSGTALGLEQIKLLKRYSNNIAIAFDGDSAGVAAAKRGIDIALSEGLNVKAIRIPEGKGKDADECLKNNSEVWFSSVKNASDVLHWFFEMAFLNKSTSDPKEKQKIANELLPIIGLIPYAVERDYWLKELAGRLGTDTSVLRDDMKRFNKNKKSIQDEKLGGNSKNVANLDRLDMLLKRFLMILVYSPQYISSLLSSLKEEYWQGGVYEHLYEFIKNHYNSNQGNAADVWRNFFDGSEFKNDFEDLKMTAQIQIENLEDVSIKDELVELVVQIKEEWVKKRRKEIGQKLALVSAEKNPDKQLMEKLLIELQSI
jgi:DNA primase